VGIPDQTGSHVVRALYLHAALAHYRAGLDTRRAELDATEAELAPWAGREPLAGTVAQLGCYRGHRRAAQPGPGRRGRRLASVPVRESLHGALRAWCLASTRAAIKPAAARSPKSAPNQCAPL
jgi:hypothetical protein